MGSSTLPAQFRVYSAGGNMGGDADQNGDPVIDGMLYVAKFVGDGEELTVAGPFPSFDLADAAAVKLQADAELERLVKAAAAAYEVGDHATLRGCIFELLVLVGSEEFNQLSSEILTQRHAATDAELSEVRQHLPPNRPAFRAPHVPSERVEWSFVEEAVAS